MRTLKLAATASLLLAAAAACPAQGPKVGDKVWAQWRPNAWYHGTLEKKAEVGFHVKFDDGDEADVPPSLLASDDAPKKDAIKAGGRILVPRAEGPSQTATVVKVEGDKVECRLEDLSDHTAELKDVRAVNTASTAGKTAKVGDMVWAQWRPNAWFHGKVAKAADGGFHVEFDDGDMADLGAAVVAIDKAPAKNAVKPGTRVLATWSDGKFYPGTVAATGEKFTIKFDDGDEGEAPLDDLRLLNE